MTIDNTIDSYDDDWFNNNFDENAFKSPDTYHLMYISMPTNFIQIYERLINDAKSLFALNWLVPGYVAYSRNLLLYGRMTEEKAIVWLIWFTEQNSDSIISQILDLLYRDYLIDIRDSVKVFVCSIDENGKYERIL